MVEKNEVKGVVYLITNDLYEKEGLYKYGQTANPYQRMGIQKNFTPQAYPLKYKLIILSEDYKTIEHELKNKFKERGLLEEIKNKNGGAEWIKCSSYEEIVGIFEEVCNKFDAEMWNGKKAKKNKKEKKKPNEQLSLCGIHDGDEIKCKKDGKKFQVKGNKIILKESGEVVTLSGYMSKNHPRKGKTNNYNGYDEFLYGKKVISTIWKEFLDMFG